MRNLLDVLRHERRAGVFLGAYAQSSLGTGAANVALLVLDPDYSFTKAYGLRWDAPKETAYPSSFIIGKDGKVAFAHVSKKHGDRVGVKTVLKALHPATPMM